MATEMLHQPPAIYGSWTSQAISYIVMFKLEVFKLQVALQKQRGSIIYMAFLSKSLKNNYP